MNSLINLILHILHVISTGLWYLVLLAESLKCLTCGVPEVIHGEEEEKVDIVTLCKGKWTNSCSYRVHLFNTAFLAVSFYQPRSGRSTFDVGHKKRRRKNGNVSFFCHFCLCAWNIFNWSNYMGVYELAWTPAIIFETIWTRGQILGPRALWPQI